MNALAFDTNATVKALTVVGFDEARAEAITGAMRSAVVVSVAS